MRRVGAGAAPPGSRRSRTGRVELETKATDPARVGSIGARRRAASATAARPRWSVPNPATSRARSCSTAWSSRVRGSRPRSSRASRKRDPGGRGRGRRARRRRRRRFRRRPVRAGRGHPPRRSARSRRQELVEHRLGVAHAAGREPGDRWTASGRPRPSASRIRELALDLGDGQPADVVALESRQDGRREARRLGRGEHEDDEVGRLLDRLQERVPGVLRDLVGLVEDIDLASELAGRIGSRSRRSRTASMPRLRPRRSRPGRASCLRGSRRTTTQRSHASPSWRSVQLSALARMRASEVLPVPRGPTNRTAWRPGPADGVAQGLDDRVWPTICRRSGLASGDTGPDAGRRLGHDAPPSRGQASRSAVHPPSTRT